MELSGLPKKEIVQRLLDTIENDIVPVTTDAVRNKGNKVFGAAILKLSDLSLVCVGTNTEVESPLWHGEVACIQNFWKLPAEGRPLPSECLMLATHEPCPMCISAITWSAFPEVHFLFSMEDSRDAFKIPHDLRIFREVFQCERATSENAFWKAYNIPKVVESLPDAAELTEKISSLRATYASLSDQYQASKSKSSKDTYIPLA
ncbi:unnamed protein product [Ascophyllum nodosum]